MQAFFYEQRLSSFKGSPQKLPKTGQKMTQNTVWKQSYNSAIILRLKAELGDHFLAVFWVVFELFSGLFVDCPIKQTKNGCVTQPITKFFGNIFYCVIFFNSDWASSLWTARSVFRHQRHWPIGGRYNITTFWNIFHGSTICQNVVFESLSKMKSLWSFF